VRALAPTSPAGLNPYGADRQRGQHDLPQGQSGFGIPPGRVAAPSSVLAA